MVSAGACCMPAGRAACIAAARCLPPGDSKQRMAPRCERAFILRLSRVDWLLQALHTCAVTSWPGRCGLVRQSCRAGHGQLVAEAWRRSGRGGVWGVGAWGLSLKKIEHLKGGVSGIFLSTGPIYLIIDSSVLGCLCEHRKCKNNLWPWLTGQWYGCACLFFPSCSNLRIKAVVKECTARL